MSQPNFSTLHEQAASIVKKIKQKNDLIVRGSVDSHERLVTEINNDKEFFNREVRRLNEIIRQMEKTYVDPLTIKKIDNLKKEARKQISRNEQLIKDLIKTTYETLSQQNSMASPPPKHSPEIEMGPKHISGHSSGQKSLMLIKQDTKLEDQLEMEKNKVLKDFQQNIIEIHSMMKQTGELVNYQGQTLDLISDAVQTTKKNVDQAGQNMQEASQHQKKHVKYLIIAGIVVIVVAGIVVTVLLLHK